jgi:hypothetical protein
MPPLDPTPLGDEMVHRLPERKFPQPKPQEQPSSRSGDDLDIGHRPALPEHPERMAADTEGDTAATAREPRLDDGIKGPQKQKG